MRIASIITAEPAALSVAPVPACHESKCAPSITISSALSVPGNLADDVEGRADVVVEGVLDVQLEPHRDWFFSSVRRMPSVVLDGESSPAAVRCRARSARANALRA